MPGLVAPSILGKDFAGKVVATGQNVQGYKKGDDVFGQLKSHGGTYAEYTAFDPTKHFLTIKPVSLPFSEAAGIPMGALTAYAGLITYGGLSTLEATAKTQKGPRVIVIGASGAVGHLATQMAKNCLGASIVVGVCSARNSSWVRDMGCDDVVEYDAPDQAGGTLVQNVGRTNWPEWKQTFDIIFDTVGRDDLYSLWAGHLLKPSAKWVTCAFPVADGGARRIGIFDMLSFAMFMGRKAIAGSRKWQMVWELDDRGWKKISQWVDEGKLRAHIHREMPLSEAWKAHELVEEGHVAGKIVLIPPSQAT
ncbi:hypothetical protein HDU93_004262 [Gonapodya sp. JEL0774]|nr:hypothetical protein HDU93_004262 [Gonapodya sp. JEL0774]